MRAQRTDFVVGLVITLAIVVLVFGIIYLKEYNVGRETKPFFAMFEDVGTLTEGDPVKVNGVKMGKVVSRVIQGNEVLVGMEIDAALVIPSDSRITIQNVGLMGERMIGIRLGVSPTPVDGTAPMRGHFDSGIAEAMGMMGDVFTDTKELVLLVRQLVDQTVASEEFLTTFKNVTARLDRLTAALDRMVAGNEKALDGVVSDLSETTHGLKTLVSGNQEKLTGMVDNFSNASVRANAILEKADQISGRIDEILVKINSEDGTVGKLLKDEAFYSTLKSTLIQADSLLKTINKSGKIKVSIF